MNLLGHKDTQKTLLRLIESGKLPHAMLFYGSKGIGKRLLADTLAKHVLCGASKERDMLATEILLDYDISSPIYPQIEAGSCPDFNFLQPEEKKKSISVEQIRASLHSLSLSSDGKRFLIVDCAEELNSNGANALLKTLEEPNDGIYIILISHNISRLLPTIISRCRKFRFSNLSLEETENILIDNYSKENPRSKLSPEEATAEMKKLALLCNGSPGDAGKYNEKAQEVIAEIEKFVGSLAKQDKRLVTPSKLLAIAELINRKKEVPLAIDLLLSKIAKLTEEDTLIPDNAKASKKGLNLAELYSKIHFKQEEMKALNINPLLAMENCLSEVARVVGK